MQLGYVTAAGAGSTDALLAGFAGAALKRGLALRGIVQSNTDCAGGGKCDMDVRVLPDGPVFRISQSLGSQSRGCRLDSAALEQAVGHVLASLDAAAQLLIVNKFGKQEAAGQGMRAAIARALDLDVPVLVGVNPRNLAGFQAFAAGLAVPVAPTEDGIHGWLTGTAAPANGSLAATGSG